LSYYYYSSIFAICLWVWLGLNVDQIQCHNLLWIKEKMLFHGCKLEIGKLCHEVHGCKNKIQNFMSIQILC
jgi:hypothetical protein